MAFSTTNAVLLTGVLVTGGQWAEGKPLTPRVVIASGVLALFLATLSEANPGLGSRFALLILVAAFLRYAVPIFSKLNLGKENRRRGGGGTF